MLNLIYGALLGVIVSSIVWFFVWRNNKKLLIDTLDQLDRHLD